MSDSPANWNRQIIDQFRANDGLVESPPFGRALVLLHHLGAKSGKERIAPVRAIPDGDGWLIAASKGGAPENPSWYHNLLAHPDVSIEVPGEADIIPVHAEELKGQARDDAWGQFKAASQGFRDYEEKTSRIIPVLVLHRR
jgi:deazaflavin-dependent oxidoreductase (nitroreductase family)